MPEEPLDGAEPTPDAPESGPDEAPASTPAVDWEADDNPYRGRYEDLRSQYDRIHPRYSQYETFVNNLTNPETQPEALRALGLEIEDDEAEGVYDDPDQRWEQRFDQIESYLSQQAEQAQQAEIQGLEKEWLTESLKEIEKSENVQLSAEEKRAIENLGYSVRDQDGIQDYQAAYKLFCEASEASRQRYLKSKDSAKVELGTAGTEKIDLSNDDARVNLLANMIEAGQQE